MFTKAIVRTPSRSLLHGITTSNLGPPDYELALQQHAKYIEALEACGLAVTVLDADENHPDSTFVEDVALCTPHLAILTRPGAGSRRGEVAAMTPVLSGFFQEVVEIEAPGTLEAGDIMMVGSCFYIGLSERTNAEGADQLSAHLQRHRMTAINVPLTEFLHLKTAVSYLENNTMLACGELLHSPLFKSFTLLEVDDDEAYAANSLWVNGTVLVPAAFDQTRAKIESAGYPTMSVDVSEFRKLDGGLSCLSLRF